jgi:hypothetical protein
MEFNYGDVPSRQTPKQSKGFNQMSCAITNDPWYVSNFTLHNDLQIPFVAEEIKRYSTIYHNRLIGHDNNYVSELNNRQMLDAE